MSIMPRDDEGRRFGDLRAISLVRNSMIHISPSSAPGGVQPSKLPA